MGTTVLGSDFYYGYYGISIASFSGVFLTASANLSDVASASNSRTNLGVPAIADIYTQIQLQTSGSASVHWANITNNVWTKPAANIVAGYDIDLSLNDITNVSTMFSTNITNSAILTTQSIINSQWDSGQTGSIIIIDSITGQFDRLQTIYYDGTFHVTEQANFSRNVTVGETTGDVLTVNSTSAFAGPISVSHDTGNSIFSQMTSDVLSGNRPAWFRHISALNTGIATGLRLEHQSTYGSYTDNFGVGITFIGGNYPSTLNTLGQIYVQSTNSVENTGQMVFEIATAGSLAEMMVVDYDEIRFLEKINVVPVSSGDNYIYSFPGDITHIVSRTGSTSAVIDSLVVKTESSSSPGDGFGTSILFKVGQVTPTETDIARISARFEGGTTNSEIVLAPMISEVAQENLIIGVTEINFKANVIPTATATYDIGSDGKRIDTVYTGWFRLGTEGVDKMIFNTSSANFDTHVLPLTDDTYQLGDGASVLRWAEVHAASLGSLTYPIDNAYIGEVKSTTEVGALEVTQSTSGEFAAIFESNSGLNNGNNGIIIRAGSGSTHADGDVFIMFEDQAGNVIGGIEWATAGFAFFSGTTPN